MPISFTYKGEANDLKSIIIAVDFIYLFWDLQINGIKKRNEFAIS